MRGPAEQLPSCRCGHMGGRLVDMRSSRVWGVEDESYG